jgi:Gpi18-like mannosyltransferase
LKNKRFFLCFIPLLLCLLLPFDISLGVFYHTLYKYGSINPYLFVFSIGATAALFFDFYIKNEALQQKIGKYLWLSVLLVASLIIRLLLFDFQSGDYQNALSVWFEAIKAKGGFAALADGDISDYNALYLYITAFLTYLPLYSLYSIKISSIVFDYIGALAVYRIARLHSNSQWKPIIIVAVFLFYPTILFNSALWAQCDMAHGSFLLWTLYFILRYIAAQTQASEKELSLWIVKIMVAFSIALMFKLQSVFVLFPFLLLYVRQIITPKYLLIIPAVWIATLLPNWLIGRDLADLLLIYARQVVRYPSLTLNAPSVYQLLPSAPFEIFNRVGIFFTLCASVAMGVYFIHHKTDVTAKNMVHLAFLSNLFIPFFLPKMHERYFFGADVFVVVYVLYFPHRWFVLPLVGVCTTLSYLPFLFGVEDIPFRLLTVVVGAIVLLTLKDFVVENRRLASKF